MTSFLFSSWPTYYQKQFWVFLSINDMHYLSNGFNGWSCDMHSELYHPLKLPLFLLWRGVYGTRLSVGMTCGIIIYHCGILTLIWWFAFKISSNATRRSFFMDFLLDTVAVSFCLLFKSILINFPDLGERSFLSPHLSPQDSTPIKNSCMIFTVPAPP